MDRIGDEKPELKNFLEVYKKNIGSYVEKCFKARFPETMLPNFSIGNRVDTYFKPDINTRNAKEGITVEEYKVESIKEYEKQIREASIHLRNLKKGSNRYNDLQTLIGAKKGFIKYLQETTNE